MAWYLRMISKQCTQSDFPTVFFTNIRLARPPQRTYSINRRLPLPNPPLRLPILLQDPQRYISHPSHRSSLPPARQRSLLNPALERSGMETLRLTTRNPAHAFTLTCKSKQQNATHLKSTRKPRITIVHTSVQASLKSNDRVLGTFSWSTTTYDVCTGNECT